MFNIRIIERVKNDQILAVVIQIILIYTIPKTIVKYEKSLTNILVGKKVED